VFDPALYRTPEEYWTDMGRIASQVSRLQAIQSPYIVSRHAYDETYGIGYSQMEAIDGVDLRSFLSTEHLELARRNCSRQEWERFTSTIFNFEDDRFRLRLGVVVYILRRILRGLERLHDANFLHSDVKPGNVMIDRLGNVRLIDFGRAVMAGERVTFLFGSPMYMAPETHRREPGGYYSDLYSAGLVGVEMLRGEPLTDGSVSDEEELLRTKMDLPDKLFEILPHSVRRRRFLVRILRRLVEPDPSARFQTAREAESGDDGLVVVDKQFTKAGMDAQYGRELGDYLSKLVDTRTQRVEVQPGDVARQGSSSGIIV
jgi:serine/threonine protein kinase